MLLLSFVRQGGFFVRVLTSKVVKLPLLNFPLLLIKSLLYGIVAGSAGGLPAAVSLAVQRYPEREVLPGDHIIVRTPSVEPPLQGPEERGKDGHGQGKCDLPLLHGILPASFLLLHTYRIPYDTDLRLARIVRSANACERPFRTTYVRLGELGL